MVFKLATNTLLNNIILFINNYFTCLELIIALKDRRIVIYETMKLGRKDLSKLLVEMK